MRGRIAENVGAEGITETRRRIVARVDNGLRRQGSDQVLHADVIIIDREREARDPVWLQDQARGVAVRRLGLEGRVAAVQEPQRYGSCRRVDETGRNACSCAIGRPVWPGADVSDVARVADEGEIL